MADHLLLSLSTSSCAFPAILYTTTTGHLTHAWCRDESLRKSYPSSHLYRYIYKESRLMTSFHSFIHFFRTILAVTKALLFQTLQVKLSYLLIPLQVPLSATAKHHKKKALVEQSLLNSKPLQKANITGSCCAVPLVTRYLIFSTSSEWYT